MKDKTTKEKKVGVNGSLAHTCGLCDDTQPTSGKALAVVTLPPIYLARLVAHGVVECVTRLYELAAPTAEPRCDCHNTPAKDGRQFKNGVCKALHQLLSAY